MSIIEPRRLMQLLLRRYRNCPMQNVDKWHWHWHWTDICDIIPGACHIPWSATVILSWWHHRISSCVAQCSPPPGQWIIILVSTHRPNLAPVTKITDWTVSRKSSIHRSILIFKSVILCWISDILFVFPSYANSPVWAGDRAGRAGAASCWSWRNISVQADLCAPRVCLVCVSPAQLAAPAPASHGLVTAPSALGSLSLLTRLGSVSVGLLCWQWGDHSEPQLHRAGLPANTDTRPWLTPRPPTSPNSSSSRPAEPRRR